MRARNASLIVLVELIALGGLYLFSKEIIDAFGIGDALPKMPVIERAWVGFAIIVAIIVWLRLRGANLRDYGLKAPKPLWRILLIAIVGAVTAIFVSTVTDPIIARWFGETDTTVFEGVEGNLGLYLYLLPFVWLFAAFGEEFFYRAFLMSGVAQLLGGGRAAWIFALVFQAVLFGFGHEYQGIGGMIGTGLYGLVYGVIYLAAGRNIWAPAIAHGLLNTLGFTLMYLGAL